MQKEPLNAFKRELKFLSLEGIDILFNYSFLLFIFIFIIYYSSGEIFVSVIILNYLKSCNFDILSTFRDGDKTKLFCDQAKFPAILKCNLVRSITICLTLKHAFSRSPTKHVFETNEP